MRPNKDGFLIPFINSDKCTNCGLCEKNCPYLNIKNDLKEYSLNDLKNYPIYLYYSNKKERKESASGAFVYDVYTDTLNNQGYACGCVWDENIKARHIVSKQIEDIYKMQSSKYVQSDMKDSFKLIRSLLKQNQRVTFCGTPCQTAGLNSFLGKLAKSENLISISLICHGVPSPKVWEYYKKQLEKKFHGTLKYVNMRDKEKKGYSLSYARYDFISNDQIKSVSWPTYLSDPYIYLFTDNLFLRNSCYHCPYKSNNSKADIIVGDFYASTEGAGNDGCSCLIALTPKGNNVIELLSGVKKESTIYEIGHVNSMIYQSVQKHPLRDSFFEDLNKNNLTHNILSQYLPSKFYIKNILGKLGLFNYIKKIIK